jgi:hypothetical protein
MDSMVEGTALILSAAERSKLAGIQAGATVNDNAAQVKIKYEANADTNAFTDAEQTKLGTVESGADKTSTHETSHADVLQDGDIGVTVAAQVHLHTGTYEPVFAKATGFNKPFGALAGYVAEGNHAHAGVYEPADATILKNANIGVTIPPLVHTHTEGQITDLRAYILANAVTYELLDTNGDVGTGAGQLAIGNHTHTRMTVFVEDMDAELAVATYVPTADGAGGVTWEEQEQSGVTEAFVIATAEDVAIAMAIALG